MGSPNMLFKPSTPIKPSVDYFQQTLKEMHNLMYPSELKENKNLQEILSFFEIEISALLVKMDQSGITKKIANLKADELNYLAKMVAKPASYLEIDYDEDEDEDSGDDEFGKTQAPYPIGIDYADSGDDEFDKAQERINNFLVAEIDASDSEVYLEDPRTYLKLLKDASLYVEPALVDSCKYKNITSELSSGDIVLIYSPYMTTEPGCPVGYWLGLVTDPSNPKNMLVQVLDTLDSLQYPNEQYLFDEPAEEGEILITSSEDKIFKVNL